MTSIQKQMRHVYAIVRVDQSDYPHPLAGITVKKIVQSEERPEREVRRLNEINADKNCDYFVQLTRLEPYDFEG